MNIRPEASTPKAAVKHEAPSPQKGAGGAVSCQLWGGGQCDVHMHQTIFWPCVYNQACGWWTTTFGYICCGGQWDSKGGHLTFMLALQWCYHYYSFNSMGQPQIISGVHGKAHCKEDTGASSFTFGIQLSHHSSLEAQSHCWRHHCDRSSSALAKGMGPGIGWRVIGTMNAE